MRVLTAPFTWFGRVLLWVFLLPIGIWRSLVHHRKKQHRKTMREVEKVMAKQRES